MQVVAVKIHEPDTVRDTLRDALTITAELDAPADLTEAVFNAAVGMLSLRYPVVNNETVPVRMDLLKGHR